MKRSHVLAVVGLAVAAAALVVVLRQGRAIGDATLPAMMERTDDTAPTSPTLRVGDPLAGDVLTTSLAPPLGAASPPPIVETARLRVENLRGEPVAGIGVYAVGPDGTPECGRATRADGWVEFARHEVALDRAGFVTCRLALGVGLGGVRTARIRIGDERVIRIAGLAEVEVFVQGAEADARVGIGGTATDHWTFDEGQGLELPLAGRASVRFPVAADSGPMCAYVRQGSGGTAATFESPRVGEILRVDLHVRSAPVELTGIVRDERGESVGGMPLRVEVRRIGLEESKSVHATSPPDLRTDADGRFVFAIDGAWIGAWAELRVAIGPRGESAGGVDAVRLVEGRNDVGIVVVAPLVLLAAGTIVDDSGAPVADAEVTVWPASPISEEPWSARSGVDGAFEVFGRARGVELAGSATAPGFRSTSFDIDAPGRRDHVVVAHRGALLEGRVEFADGTPAPGLSVVVRPADSRRVSTATASDGSFRLSSLAIGSASLEASDGGTVLARLDVEVRIDGARDPRIDPLRLEAEVMPIEIDFVSESGGPLASVAFAARARDEQVAVGPLRLGLGLRGPPRRRLHVLGQPLDFVAGAPGHRVLVVRGLESSRTFTLRRAPQAVLRMGSFPADHTPLELTWTVESLGVIVDGPLLRVRDGRAELPIVFAGTYRFQLVQLRADGERSVFVPGSATIALDPDAPRYDVVLEWPADTIRWIAEASD